MAAESAESSRPKRPWCPGCERPCRTCLCDTLPSEGPLETRTKVVLLVHPKEVRRALGTAPLLRLCLEGLILRVGDRFPEPEEDPGLHAALAESGRSSFLVCPGPGAEALEPAADPSAEDSGPPRTLIFVDGRWDQAKAMVHRSPWLRDGIPRVVLKPTEQSGYVFRQQPEEGCLSTVEAVAEALLALEGARGPAIKAALLKPFRRMVEQQCNFIPEVQDKNADLGSELRRTRPFDPKEAVAIARHIPSDSGDGEGEALHCVVHWGPRSVGGRETVVVEVLRCAVTTAKRRASELSAGRCRGQRCWVLPLDQVPEGAKLEEEPASSAAA